MPPFVHRLRVRYNECDAQGAVFNSNYLMYFDVALTELWREMFGSYNAALEKFGVDLVVGEATVRYLKPAKFDDELDIEITVEKIGTTSMSTTFVVDIEGTKIARGSMRHVFVDDRGRKAPVPDDIRAALDPYHARDREGDGEAEKASKSSG